MRQDSSAFARLPRTPHCSSRQKREPSKVIFWDTVASGDLGLNGDRWGRQRWAMQGPGRRCFSGCEFGIWFPFVGSPFSSPHGHVHPQPNRHTKHITTKEVPVTAGTEESVEVVVPEMKE